MRRNKPIPVHPEKNPEKSTIRRAVRSFRGLLTLLPTVLPGLFFPSLQAEVPELLKHVPDTKGYEVIYKFNPLDYAQRGYQIDNGDRFSGTLKRIGYLLKLTDLQGKETWAFASMDPFSQDLNKVGVPNLGSGVFQVYVNNLEVAGSAPNLRTGKFEKGNIEFWPFNYGGANVQKIPGATDAYDFGDAPSSTGSYGSMQIHNYLAGQTVISFNNFDAGQNCDVGIGSNTGNSQPDWTFSSSGKNCKTAEMLVVGQFDSLKILPTVKVDPQKITFQGKTEKAFFAPGEPIRFLFTLDLGDQPVPNQPYTLHWVRTGDDGKNASGQAPFIPGKPLVVETRLDAPGFVRMQADVRDHRGKIALMKWHDKQLRKITFDGGAGVEPEKLQPAATEPADFDAFWKKQKARLSEVPLHSTIKKVSSPGAKVDVYAVSIDCAGPRPVTGYLTIPAGAKAKSLPASAAFDGYSIRVQKAPSSGPENRMNLHINAHGYDLEKEDAYYKEFFDGIQSNGKIYAFDPKQNSNPETAYFNGMTLRVMRALQFLKSRPEWDGKNLTVSGGSQGGLQTIWAAALDPDVTKAVSNITWCCDLGGPAKGRLKGWRPEYVPSLNYYDPVFHAKRIRCPVVIARAGLGDYTCPPSGLAILYNNLQAPKEIVWVQGSTHGYVPPEPQNFIVEKK